MKIFDTPNTPTEIIKLDMENAEVYLYVDFIPKDKQQPLFEKLMKTIDWRTEYIKYYGKDIKTPRLVADYGNVGTELKDRRDHSKLIVHEWTEELFEIKEKLKEDLNYDFSFARLNYYRDGKDKANWHTDKMLKLANASISLGATRLFQFRRKGDKQSPTIDIYLKSGEMVVMTGDTQDYWEHSVPVDNSVDQPRINITYRDM